MASDDKSVSIPIASKGSGTQAEPDYPDYKVSFRGPGIPTGAGSGEPGEAIAIGPHTCVMKVLEGKYQITLEHNSPTDANPDLIVRFIKVP